MIEGSSFSVRVHGVSAYVLAHIIKIIYSQHFQLSLILCENLYVLANYFCMETICGKCMLYLESHIDTDNAVQVLRFAASISDGKLYEFAGLFILTHLSNMLRDDPMEFYSLSYGELTQFLSHDYLQINREEEVLTFILKWITFDTGERITLLEDLAKNIRFAWIVSELSQIGIEEYSMFFADALHNRIILQVLNAMRLQHNDMNSDLVRVGELSPRVPKNSILIVGGWSSYSNDTVGFETYDAFTGRWYEDPSQPDVMNLAYHGCCVIGNDIYVVGGYDGVRYYDCIRRFNTVTQVWTNLKDMDDILCYITVSALGEDIYVIGGFNGQYRLRDVLKYSVVSNKWTSVASMSVVRSDSSSCTLKGY